MKKTTLASVLLLAAGLGGCERGETEVAAPTASPASSTVLCVSIEGMSCDGCVSSVGTAVAAVEGVTSCEVSLEEGSAVIELTDPTLADTVVQAINDLHYEAKRTDC